MLHALSVDYGQRHRFELEAAARVARSLEIARHVTLKLDLASFGGSALTSELAVPKDRPRDEMEHGIPITYVPARNTVFLSLALAFAESCGAAGIVRGRRHASRPYGGSSAASRTAASPCGMPVRE